MGVSVDLLEPGEAIDKIEKYGSSIPDRYFVVTAYSEFFVLANKDKEFMDVINKANLVTPDGVSVLAAAKFIDLFDGSSLIKKLFGGLHVGSLVFRGKVGNTVTGVWLFNQLCEIAAKKGKRVFLLGGWNGVASKVTRILLKRYPDLEIAYDEGEKQVGTDLEVNERVISKINKFKPHYLFVAYNPVKQEKWIARHLNRLSVGTVIGVGGTYNEFVGDLPGAPRWARKAGLTWAWRLVLEPKRWKRILRAVIEFPWLVFKSC